MNTKELVLKQDNKGKAWIALTDKEWRIKTFLKAVRTEYLKNYKKIKHFAVPLKENTQYIVCNRGYREHYIVKDGELKLQSSNVNKIIAEAKEQIKKEKHNIKKPVSNGNGYFTGDFSKIKLDLKELKKILTQSKAFLSKEVFTPFVYTVLQFYKNRLTVIASDSHKLFLARIFYENTDNHIDINEEPIAIRYIDKDNITKANKKLTIENLINYSVKEIRHSYPYLKDILVSDAVSNILFEIDNKDELKEFSNGINAVTRIVKRNRQGLNVKFVSKENTIYILPHYKENGTDLRQYSFDKDSLPFSMMIKLDYLNKILKAMTAIYKDGDILRTRYSGNMVRIELVRNNIVKAFTLMMPVKE